MIMNPTKSLIAAALAVMLLGACSSGGIGDILGGNNNNTTTELRGTVDSVDASSRSILLTNVTGYNGSMLSSGGSGKTVRVYYDDQTSVDWQGRAYRPQDLERGDQVSVNVDQSGSTLVAESMTVTYNSTGGMTSGSTPNDSYGSSIRGTVRYIDTNRGTIEVARSSGSNVIVEFTTSTPVYYNNKTYRAADLEVGDQIDIRYRDLGNGRVSAQDISVTRSISDTGGTTSTNYATIRGTVRSIDTARRTIQLESTTWRSGFTGNTGSGNLITISYDTGMGVDVNGQTQALTGLERGDVVDVQVQTSNTNASTYWAQRISLVRDVRN
jgi:hypothetical protein